MSLSLRDATAHDAGLIAGFVRALAEYEKLSHEAVATDADFAHVVQSGLAPAIIAEWDGAPVGFALWYYTFSTFTGRPDMFLEDLFVEPDHRGTGIGLALLRHLARRAVSERCRRIEWRVLNWNQPSIDFYERIGARPMEDWHVRQLGGAALIALAEGADHG